MKFGGVCGTWAVWVVCGSLANRDRVALLIVRTVLHHECADGRGGNEDLSHKQTAGYHILC